MTLLPAYSIPPLALRPIGSFLTTPNLEHLTSVFSSTSALFACRGTEKVFCYQSSAHSFPLNGGWGVPLSDLPPEFRIFFQVPYTLTPFVSHSSSKDCRGGPSGDSWSTVNGGLSTLDFFTNHHSRVTSHRHPSYCARSRAVPEWRRWQDPMFPPSTGKQSRSFRCLRKGADSGFGNRSTPNLARRSILNGDVGRPELSSR